MKPTKKQVVTTTTLILILAFAAFFATASPAAAAVDVPTFAFLSVQPNPVGVNEQVYVVMFMADPPPTAMGPQGDRWQGYKVTITKPDASIEEKGPYTSDDVSGAAFAYTPDMVGKYTFVFKFPGQHIVADVNTGFGPPQHIDNNYLPSTSRTVTLTVTTEPSPKWQEVPVPNYWTRPIYGENRELASLGGNWLMPAYSPAAIPGGAGIARAFDWGAAYAPNNKAPGTAHILWTRAMTFGGMVGNEMPSVSYYTGLSYEQMFKPPIIINGRLYYNLYKSTYGYAPYNHPGFVCVDMSTGEELWRNMDTWVDFGQIYDYESPNQAGATAYLWMINGTTLTMMEAFDGTRILDIANCPAPGGMFGSNLKMGPHGELYIYVMDATTNTLARWNSYTAIGPYLPTGSESWQWRPYSKVSPLDGTKGYDWNVSIASANIPGLAIAQLGPGDVIYAGAGGGFLSQFGNDKWAAFDINNGNLLYTTTIQRPAGLPGSATGPIGEGVYAEYTRQTLQWNAYDIKTGAHLWTSAPYTDDWALYGTYMGQMIADGKLLHAGYDGYIHAFDLKTGNSVWDYYSGNAGAETPYGTYPFYGGFVYADGKVFGHTSEHSPVTPMWRGEKLHAINAANGQSMWKMSGWFQHPAVADGKLLSLNGYDNKIYCFGKGPSATTVSAPQTAVPQGTTVLITGTVTDQSPEAKGTPAVSDGDQEAWMEYLYMQKACPATLTGVPVVLTAVGPDGGSINIGTVMSDGSGLFKKSWTPPSQGEYVVTATFAGTESYGNSYATTAMIVGPAAAAGGGGGGGTTTTTSTSTDLYIIIATVVILIAIAIAVVALRKR
ncbi:MAG: PQQ-binding-like beta-propeller repeat protein [Candidatus Bathyarchaeia archaeon]